MRPYQLKLHVHGIDLLEFLQGLKPKWLNMLAGSARPQMDADYLAMLKRGNRDETTPIGIDLQLVAAKL